MSRRFNPNGFVNEARAFLTAEPETLDRGYSLPLRTLAMSARDVRQALLFLLYAPVQEEIDAIAAHVEGSSLD
eukprot:9282226-Lingulodinium_polyedra.AAC.1